VAVSEHKASAPSGSSVRVAVVSVSDTRTVETDEGGALVQTLTARAGFSVVARELVRDDPDTIRVRVHDLAASGGVDAILLTGGTGIAARDGTVDAVAPLFARRLDGFGELFRMLSFAEIGPAAMLSRATAGIVDGVVIFLMPGSPAAVKLALERLILPELSHLVGELRKPAGDARALDDAGEAASHHRPHHHGHDDRDRH
jgi:molybdenum cofactor biosynthesis protein B